MNKTIFMFGLLFISKDEAKDFLTLYQTSPKHERLRVEKLDHLNEMDEGGYIVGFPLREGEDTAPYMVQWAEQFPASSIAPRFIKALQILN